jgi:lipopolysaccharide transport system ATP-binding protein
VKNLVIDGVSKRYWVAKSQQKDAAAETRFDRFRSIFALPIAQKLGGGRELWALNNVSFDVDQGQVLGIIGSNGAGKSTLLKVIAKVISPTAGTVRGRGRVVSLLELGAGFDDESSARDNVYMNAAMNGIPRAVVNRRFDDIIAFAEMQDFVDTELQYYSSGMYLRLAFSVAINMEPSILLADEILAVGDLAFQERCLQKVREMARDQGLTVLFVSHDMEAVSRICDRVVWLKDGAVHRDGHPEEIVTEYQNAAWELLTADAVGADAPTGSHACRYGEIIDVRLLSADGREIGSPPRSEDLYIRIRFRTRTSKTRARCSFHLYSKGILVLSSVQPEAGPVSGEHVYEAHARVPANLLSETRYSISAGVTLIKGEGTEYPLTINRALSFMVYDQQGADTPEMRHRKGLVDPTLEWTAPAVASDAIVRA